MFINGTFECFTLEDTFNEPKVWGKTRIPEGTYDIILRNEGGMTVKYAKRYPNHKGMIWLQDVPGFEWVYIHTGNNENHTDGCILVGDSVYLDNGTIGNSRDAYKDLYSKILVALDNGEEITVEIIKDKI